MTKLTIDGLPQSVDILSDLNLGDALDRLVTELPPSRIVAEVSIDGKSLRSFIKNDSLWDSRCDHIDDISIRTVDREVWSASGIDMALSSAERVKLSFSRVAELFRTSAPARAQSHFVTCIEGLEKFLENMMISRSVLQLDFETIKWEDITLAQLERDLKSVLDNLLLRQESHEILAIADTIEDELVPNLSRWVNALTQLRNSRNSNA